jgi:ArsR family transcriptional regulator
MDDESLDMLLSMVENPTRRRILDALTREPHYPLQLSRELGVSAQAIMKNLNTLERNGIVVSYRESTNIGPERIVYQPNSEFTLMVDMRNGMFSVRLTEPQDAGIEECTGFEDLQDARGKIAGIDERISELERTRSKLMREREALIASVSSELSEDDYEHRRILSLMLNRPSADASELSAASGMDANRVAEMEKDIENALKGKDTGGV